MKRKPTQINITSEMKMSFGLKKSPYLVIKIIVICVLICSSQCRKHKLKLHNEFRDMIDVTTFGFFKNGMLAVDIRLSMLNISKEGRRNSIGFTLDKSSSDGSASYMEDHTQACILNDANAIKENDSVSVVFFKLNFTENTVQINRVGKSLHELHIYNFPNNLNDVYDLTDSSCRKAKDSTARLKEQVAGGKDMPVMDRKENVGIAAKDDSGIQTKSDIKTAANDGSDLTKKVDSGIQTKSDIKTSANDGSDLTEKVDSGIQTKSDIKRAANDGSDLTEKVDSGIQTKSDIKRAANDGSDLTEKVDSGIQTKSDIKTSANDGSDLTEKVDSGIQTKGDSKTAANDGSDLTEKVDSGIQTKSDIKTSANDGSDLTEKVDSGIQPKGDSKTAANDGSDLTEKVDSGIQTKSDIKRAANDGSDLTEKVDSGIQPKGDSKTAANDGSDLTEKVDNGIQTKGDSKTAANDGSDLTEKVDSGIQTKSDIKTSANDGSDLTEKVDSGIQPKGDSKTAANDGSDLTEKVDSGIQTKSDIKTAANDGSDLTEKVDSGIQTKSDIKRAANDGSDLTEKVDSGIQTKSDIKRAANDGSDLTEKVDSGLQENGDSIAVVSVGSSPEDNTQAGNAKPADGLITSISMSNSTDKNGHLVFNISFLICIDKNKEEGLYNLYFHHCQPSLINLTVAIVEMNGKNYLSAGDIPLPPLFITMSMVFFASAMYWLIYVRKKKEEVFKIHYLMLLLIYLKALSLLFHALDYHFIGIDGSPMEAFAILFYITYLTKGALLFIVIALVGSGWAFVKPILSDKDKQIFIVVIPLQVLANVSYIITDTSEEGESQYFTWKAVFVLVDILCCGAILYPVIWSIRHLQEAATTDGKVAISLAKLKLFRHFYVLVVCYIYFTRIIVYLLKVTVPFQYMWLDELFYELATYLFFAVTAFKFRPGSDNPYLLVPEEDEEDIEMEIVTKTGLTENIVKVSGGNSTTAVQRELNHST